MSDQPAIASPARAAKRLRVMQVVTHLGLGGAEQVAFTLMKGLLGSFDFDVFAVMGVAKSAVGVGLNAETQALGLPLFTGTRIPAKRGGMVLAGRQLARAVQVAQPDVIHLHTEIPESVYAAAVIFKPALASIPLVRTIHNSVYWVPRQGLGRWCERRMPRSFVAGVSRAALEAFAQLRQQSGAGPLPVPPRVIYNGVPAGPSGQHREPLGACPIRLLFGGRLEDQKAADLLPEIIRRVRAPGPCELSICGLGTYEATLRQFAASPPPGWTIRMEGPVWNLPSRMPQFDLLLMPSRYEGFGLMAVESLLADVPVVATGAPGLTEALPPNYPWMAPPGDAVAYAELLSRVLAQPQSWAAVAKAGASFARQHFTTGAMCEGYRQLFEEAAAKVADPVARGEPAPPLRRPASAAPGRARKRLCVMQVVTHIGLGGAERGTFRLMERLGGTFDHELFAVLGVEPGAVGAGYYAQVHAQGVRLFKGTRVPIKRGGMLLAGWQFARAVQVARPDVIHLHTEIPEGVYAAAVALQPSVGQVPLVRTIHNSVYWRPWRRMGRWCERRMPRSFIAAVSYAAKEAFLELRQESGAGPTPVPPRVIYNGVGVEDIGERCGPLGSRPMRLLFAGRLEDQKAADLLPEIIRRTRIPRPCELMIYGSGAYEQSLREFAASPPPGWTIQVQPAVWNLPARMPQFDLVLMPSRFEGFGRVAVESLLVDVPVVTTRAPGLTEALPPDYPWMAPPGDAVAYAELLSAVLAQPQTWSAAVETGGNFARKHFTVDAMCEAYRQLFEEAAASGAK
jgi:glycosyltransferase involved in cell wall biosynthesis